MAEDILLDDELTVVNNRISHLKKQITSLEQQNLKLTSDNKFATKQLSQTQSKTTRFRNILLFICAILLLLLAYILFGWLRRRQLEGQADTTEALWVPLSQTQTASEPEPPQIVQASGAEKNNAEVNTEDETEEESEGDLLPLPIGSKEETIVIEDEQAFSVLDHADVFLFHGRAVLAIQLLQNYLVERPKQSVTIWLFLLDLLAKEKLKDQYEETAAECRLHYNVNIPAFSLSETESTESLEDFPRLVQGLCDVWNSPKALIYLDDLIYNNRPTPRAGLPRNLIEELVILKAITQDHFSPVIVPPLDDKKLAEKKQKEKEAVLEKLEEIARAEKLEKEKGASLEFTLEAKK